MPNPLRVLVLDTVMDRGGAETMMMNYLRAMDRTKIQYDFLVNRPYRAAYEEEIEKLGGRIFRMCPMYPKYFRQYKKEFRSFLTEHSEYRIIHSNLEERSYFPLRIARKMGVPVRIAHSHNAPVGFDLKSIVRYYFRARLPKQVTHMFSCGEEAGDWLWGKKNRSRVVFQRNAIDTQRYIYNPDTAKEVRAELGIGDQLVVGHVGRFFPQKNHTFLIDIFAALHQKNPNTRLLLVGGGEQDNALKHEMQKKVAALSLQNAVQFLGVRRDVYRLLQAMDIFLLPSLYEGLPVSIIEAQTAGLPCLISDKVPAQCDVTKNVQVLSLNDQPAVWANQLNSIPKIDRRSMGKKVAEAGFDIQRNAQWLQNFYLDSLAKAGG